MSSPSPIDVLREAANNEDGYYRRKDARAALAPFREESHE